MPPGRSSSIAPSLPGSPRNSNDFKIRVFLIKWRPLRGRFKSIKPSSHRLQRSFEGYRNQASWIKFTNTSNSLGNSLQVFGRSLKNDGPTTHLQRRSPSRISRQRGVSRVHLRCPPAAGGAKIEVDCKMRNQVTAIAMVIVGLVWGPCAASAQPSSAGQPALVDLLVWGTYHKVDPRAYSPAVQVELEKHLQRSQEYRSTRPAPTNSSELEMVYDAQVRYERRLVAVTDDPRAGALAVEYVESLRPCYEWEGYHDCPQQEASFATEYRAANPAGPFNEFLSLLAAHRWLCTAEAYEYEKRPDGASGSRRASEQALAIARQSKALLVRMAAEELAERGRCHA